MASYKAISAAAAGTEAAAIGNNTFMPWLRSGLLLHRNKLFVHKISKKNA